VRFVIYGFCNVSVCVCVVFVKGFFLMCEFVNVWVRLIVGFVMCV